MAIDTTKTGPIDIGSGEWGQELNDWLNANAITVTDWTNAGIVMLNGFKAADPAGMVYKTVKAESFEILTVEGAILYPALSPGQMVACLQVPTSAFPVNKIVANLHDTVMVWGDQLMNLSFDSSTGKVTLTNESMRGNKKMPAGKKFISLTVGF